MKASDAFNRTMQFTSPMNCAAITPNIHREIHFGKDGTQLDEQLAALIREKEKALESS